MASFFYKSLISDYSLRMSLLRPPEGERRTVLAPFPLALL